MLKLFLIFPNFTDIICYDDACHLKRFTQNHPRDQQLTSTAKKMSQMVMPCDKFHFKNHKDMWCKRNCSPYICASLQVRFPLIQYLNVWQAHHQVILPLNLFNDLTSVSEKLDTHNRYISPHLNQTKSQN